MRALAAWWASRGGPAVERAGERWARRSTDWLRRKLNVPRSDVAPTVRADGSVVKADRRGRS